MLYPRAPPHHVHWRCHRQAIDHSHAYTLVKVVEDLHDWSAITVVDLHDWSVNVALHLPDCDVQVT